MSRRVLLALLAGLLAACQAFPAPIQMTDPRVTAGAERSCEQLGLSDIRCTLLILRAAAELDRSHPDAVVTGRELHEAGAAPAGQSPIPSSQVVAAIVVFTLEGGSRVGVPLICPRDPAGSDQACNPQVE
ncbi:MAG TPA: hypothetical protein VM344_03515 [Vitreimonas sp.]|nr:hypothetical protein [Vitreimonas sp.]